MRQKKCDALANKKGGATGPGGSFAKSDVPQHPAQSGGENLIHGLNFVKLLNS